MIPAQTYTTGGLADAGALIGEAQITSAGSKGRSRIAIYIKPRPILETILQRGERAEDCL